MSRSGFEIREEDRPAYFGPLFPFVEDDDITDIDFNGREVWITDCRSHRYIAENCQLSEEFVEGFSKRIANAVSRPFHKLSPVLEAETDTLRVTIVHESVCQGKRTFCIRKSLPRVRLTEENAISSGYASREILTLLKNCIRARMNIVFAGNPGVGKTECAKFFSSYIPENARVITIEDNPEWHYSSVNPGKDCVEMKVGESMDYTKAIKTCLRLNPSWMFLSEARSEEVRYLLEGFSTGVRGITTLHTDDVRKIPDRIVNMIGDGKAEERVENDVYSFIDLAVLIRRKEVRNDAGFHENRRYIDQICFFSRADHENHIYMVVEDGRVITEELPEVIRKRFENEGICSPFSEEQTEPAGSEDSRAEDIRNENNKTEDIWNEDNRAEDIWNENSKTEDIGAEDIWNENSRIENTRTEDSKVDNSKSERLTDLLTINNKVYFKTLDVEEETKNREDELELRERIADELSRVAERGVTYGGKREYF